MKILSNFEEMIEEFHLIENIIDSCKTDKQVQSARNMIETFKNKWSKNKFGNTALAFSIALTKRSLKKIESFQS